jgi:hypothetical protein
MIAQGVQDIPLAEGCRFSMRMPSARVVAMLPQARDEPQPSVIKATRSNLPSRTATQNSMVSPQGPVMRAWPSNFESGP